MFTVRLNDGSVIKPATKLINPFINRPEVCEWHIRNCSTVNGTAESLPPLFSKVARDWRQNSALHSEDVTSQLRERAHTHTRTRTHTHTHTLNHTHSFPARGLMQAESRTHRLKGTVGFSQLINETILLYYLGLFFKERISQVQRCDCCTCAHHNDDA